MHPVLKKYSDGVDATTGKLLTGMNSNRGFLGQLKLMSDGALQTVRTKGPIIYNGKKTMLEYRQENAFVGYMVKGTGAINYDSTMFKSKEYTRFENAQTVVSNYNASPDIMPFDLHAHSFSSGSSDRDYNGTSDAGGRYVFTLIPEDNRVEILLPNGTGAYQGTYQQVFPGLGGK